MKVSAIIRTFNRGYILPEAIESALRQTHRDFELIIVDDGSIDDTAEVVGRFTDNRIRYIRHDQNRGVSAAGNSGLKAATGDVVAYLDSDDLWEPDMLGSLVDVLQRNPDVAVAFCDVRVLRGNTTSSIASNSEAFTRLLGSRGGHPGEVIFSCREMYLCLLEDVPIKPSGALIRRHVMRELGGYDEAWVSGEDWNLYLRMAKHHRFGYVNRRLATMRVLADSTLEKFQEEDKQSLLRLAISEKRQLAGDRAALRAVNRVISSHHKDLGWIYLHTGRRMKGLATYAQGFAETGHLPLAMRFVLGLAPLGAAARTKAVLRSLTGREARGSQLS
jgi:glycosyltransferase involved in cell wall biosynthesis